MMQFLAIGECMIEMSGGKDNVWRMGFAGDTLNTLWYARAGLDPADGPVGDQKRVMTPRKALDSGASILVIGRPITQADDPDKAARAIEATL